MKFAKFFAFLTACIVANSVLAQTERIVSIGGDVTEIIFALKAEPLLVGRDTTSISPKAVETLPDVGYMRQLNAEGILALKPTKVIASAVAQPATVFEQLKASGVEVETVPFGYESDDIVRKIKQIGKLVGKERQAVELAEKFANDLNAVPNSKLNTRILFVLNRAGTNQMAAGKNTVADTLIRLVGATNAMGDAVRFPSISQEGVIAADPDLIIITKIGFDALGSEEKVWQLAGLAHTPAGKAKRLLVVDDLAVMGFSLTTPAELAKIRKAAEEAVR